MRSELSRFRHNGPILTSRAARRQEDAGLVRFVTRMAAAAAATVAACSPAWATPDITTATIATGRLFVLGRTEHPHTPVVLDGRFKTESDDRGQFQYELTYYPAGCIVTAAIGGKSYQAVVGNCGQGCPTPAATGASPASAAPAPPGPATPAPPPRPNKPTAAVAPEETDAAPPSGPTPAPAAPPPAPMSMPLTLPVPSLQPAKPAPSIVNPPSPPRRPSFQRGD